MSESTFHSLLSRPEFAIFDFAPGERHTISSPEALSTARHLIEVLTAHCLDELGFDLNATPDIDVQFYAELSKWCSEHVVPLCGDNTAKLKVVKDAIRNAAVSVDYMYPRVYHDALSRMHLARVTLAGIALDDFAAHDTDEAHRFGQYVYDILMGRSEPETTTSNGSGGRGGGGGGGGWLGLFTRVVREYIAHFGKNDPRAGVLGGEVLFRYIESLESEKRFDGDIREVPPHLRPPLITTDGGSNKYHGCCPTGYARWHRAQSGGSAAYIAGLFHGVPFDYWITSLEPLLRFTDLVNDLMSFSKEILVAAAPVSQHEVNGVNGAEPGELEEEGEGSGKMDINYVTLQTLARRQAGVRSRFGGKEEEGNMYLYTYRDGLCEMMDELVRVVREADKAFVEYPKHCDEDQKRKWNMDQAARVWTAYKNGFIRMHIDAPRWSSAGLKAAVADREAWLRLKREV